MYGMGKASGPTETIIVTNVSGFVIVFANGWVLITAPGGTFGSAEFSIPTLNPKAWRSFKASAWSLPVRSGISIKVWVPPSTGSPWNIWDKVQKVPKTKPIETIKQEGWIYIL